MRSITLNAVNSKIKINKKKNIKCGDNINLLESKFKDFFYFLKSLQG
jgi:hypothetical protein